MELRGRLALGIGLLLVLLSRRLLLGRGLRHKLGRLLLQHFHQALVVSSWGGDGARHLGYRCAQVILGADLVQIGLHY